MKKGEIKCGHWTSISGVCLAFSRFGTYYDVDMILLQKQYEIKKKTEKKIHSTTELEHEDVHDEGTERRNRRKTTLWQWLVFTHLIWLNHIKACQRSWSHFSKMHGAIKVHTNEKKRNENKKHEHKMTK